MAAVKLFVPLTDRQAGLSTYLPLLRRMGVALVMQVKDADAVLPLTDRGALAVAGHHRYMSADALDAVLSRERLHETGMDVLPTVLIDDPEDAPDGALVKSRNSAQGGYVYQPHLGFPQEDLDISFSVGPNGDILPFACLRLTHQAAKMPVSNRQATEEEVSAVLRPLQDACSRLGISGGIHNVQFLQHEGTWRVIDWNPRPAMVHTEGLAALHPYFERPLAHMLGLPLPADTHPVFVTRSYWHRRIPMGMDAQIRAAGLLPRRIRGVAGFARVSGVANSQEEVDAKFTHLESLL